MHLVELKINSYRGSIGAEHYYGEFYVHTDHEHEFHCYNLERPVGQTEADYLNKKDQNDPEFYWIEAGDLVTRFNATEDVITRATEVFPSLFGASGILFYNPMKEVDDPIHGKYWEADYKVLWGADQAQTLAQSITKTGQRILREILKSMGVDIPC